MTTKQKNAIAGFLIALSASGTTLFLSPEKTKVQVQKETSIVYELPVREYNILKDLLVEKAEKRIPMTYEEYQLFVSVVNREIEKQGTITLQDPEDDKEVLSEVLKKIEP